MCGTVLVGGTETVCERGCDTMVEGAFWYVILVPLKEFEGGKF